ncbi:MAG: hypothetical protein HZB91_08595 [Elusimicrobia bacterium]|nr:hypothetical protein [Elusimicrobiota bacterium]
MSNRLLLQAYGWVFLSAGAVFLCLNGPFTAAFNSLAGPLPWAAPLPDAGRSLWLGLTGSMMAMIAYLSFILSTDPWQGAAWRALLLSKGVSSLLFLCFGLSERNLLFVIAALVDGGILLHLAWLSTAFSDLPDPWSPRSGLIPDCVHEAWFLKANDPASRDAFWLRYTLERSGNGVEGRLWYAVFDAKERKVASGTWTEPEAGACHGLAMGGQAVWRVGGSILSTASASARGPKAEWRLSWEPSDVPPFPFVPPWLYLWGLAGTVYTSPIPAAVFNGEVSVHGRTYRFSQALGSIGHLWGRRKAESWRWAHAVFLGKNGKVGSVFEILSARGRLGPFVLPPVTRAHLWRDGRHHASAWQGCRTWAADKGWGFFVNFDGFSGQGVCVPDEGLTAEFDYHDPDGRTLSCRNSKVGSMWVDLSGTGDRAAGAFESTGSVLETKDSAAVETVEPKT